MARLKIKMPYMVFMHDHQGNESVNACRGPGKCTRPGGLPQPDEELTLERLRARACPDCPKANDNEEVRVFFDRVHRGDA